MTPVVRKHAAIRIYERTSLSPKEIAEMLATGRYYPFGSDTSSEHIHKIIHSPANDSLFVVVQDSANGDVITVMPFGDHRAWRVDHVELERLARESLGLVKKAPPQKQRISLFVNFRMGSPENPKQNSCHKAGDVTDAELLSVGIDIGNPVTRESLNKALSEAHPQTIENLNAFIDEVIQEDSDAPSLDDVTSIVFGIGGINTRYWGYKTKVLA